VTIGKLPLFLYQFPSLLRLSFFNARERIFVLPANVFQFRDPSLSNQMFAFDLQHIAEHVAKMTIEALKAFFDRIKPLQDQIELFMRVRGLV
jgi:hypothetical protein